MKRFTLGMLLALVASAILVAPGGAAKPANGVTCDPTTTTVTWRAGTDAWSVTIHTRGSVWEFRSDPAVPIPNGPGSVSFTTPPDALNAEGVIFTKKGQGIFISDNNCLV